MTDVLTAGRLPSDKAYDRIAVLLLAFGGLFPPAWIVGAVLLWRGNRWTPLDKLLGTLVWPLGPFGCFTVQLFFLQHSTRVCVDPGTGPGVCTTEGLSLTTWLGYASVGFWVVSGLAVCLFLHRRVSRLDRRPAA